MKLSREKWRTISSLHYALWEGRKSRVTHQHHLAPSLHHSYWSYKTKLGRAWRCMCLIPALKRQRQVDLCEFEASLWLPSAGLKSVHHHCPAWVGFLKKNVDLMEKGSKILRAMSSLRTHKYYALKTQLVQLNWMQVTHLCHAWAPQCPQLE